MSKQKPTTKALDDVSLTLQDIGYKQQHTKIKRVKGKTYVSIVKGKPQAYRQRKTRSRTGKDLHNLFKQIAILFVRS